MRERMGVRGRQVRGGSQGSFVSVPAPLKSCAGRGEAGGVHGRPARHVMRTNDGAPGLWWWWCGACVCVWGLSSVSLWQSFFCYFRRHRQTDNQRPERQCL